MNKLLLTFIRISYVSVCLTRNSVIFYVIKSINNTSEVVAIRSCQFKNWGNV